MTLRVTSPLLQLTSFVASVLAAYFTWCAILVYGLGYSEPIAGGPDGTFHFLMELVPTLAISAGLGYSVSILALVSHRETDNSRLHIVLALVGGLIVGTAFCLSLHPLALMLVSIQLGLIVCSAGIGLALEFLARSVERRRALASVDSDSKS